MAKHKRPNRFSLKGIKVVAWIVIFKENYPEEKLTQDEHDLILEEQVGITLNSKRRTTTSEVLQAGRVVHSCTTQSMGQGQLNLKVCRSRMNREDWNLARNVISPKLDGQ